MCQQVLNIIDKNINHEKKYLIKYLLNVNNMFYQNVSCLFTIN